MPVTQDCFNLTAHARLMYRETVTIEDAVMAVSVMECSMQVRRGQNKLLYYTTNDHQSNCILSFFSRFNI